MDFTLGAVILAAIATIVGATIQGSIGFGMNLVTVPMLALVLPESLPVAVVLLGIPISIAMLRHEHRSLDRTGLGWIIGGRVPGTVLGAWVVATVTTATLQGLIGGFVLLFVLASIVSPPIPVRPGTQVAAGAASGVTGTAAGIGGPPIALLYQHHPGPQMRSTLAASFFFGTLLSITTLAIARQVSWDQVALGIGLAPLVVAGSYAGRRFHDSSTAVGCAQQCSCSPRPLPSSSSSTRSSDSTERELGEHGLVVRAGAFELADAQHRDVVIDEHVVEPDRRERLLAVRPRRGQASSSPFMPRCRGRDP